MYSNQYPKTKKILMYFKLSYSKFARNFQNTQTQTPNPKKNWKQLTSDYFEVAVLRKWGGCGLSNNSSLTTNPRSDCKFLISTLGRIAKKCPKNSTFLIGWGWLDFALFFQTLHRDGSAQNESYLKVVEEMQVLLLGEFFCG